LATTAQVLVAHLQEVPVEELGELVMAGVVEQVLQAPSAAVAGMEERRSYSPSKVTPESKQLPLELDLVPAQMDSSPLPLLRRVQVALMAALKSFG
jgi:hypothetical protein